MFRSFLEGFALLENHNAFGDTQLIKDSFELSINILIVDLMMILNHFFRDLDQWIAEMKDPRNGSYTVYTQSDYFFMGILKNVCSVGSMRQMEERFNEDTCIDTLRILSGNQELKEMPHYSSLNHYLERLSPKTCQA